MNGLLHLGHAFSLSKVRTSACVGLPGVAACACTWLAASVGRTPAAHARAEAPSHLAAYKQCTDACMVRSWCSLLPSTSWMESACCSHRASTALACPSRCVAHRVIDISLSQAAIFQKCMTAALRYRHAAAGEVGETRTCRPCRYCTSALQTSACWVVYRTAPCAAQACADKLDQEIKEFGNPPQFPQEEADAHAAPKVQAAPCPCRAARVPEGASHSSAARCVAAMHVASLLVVEPASQACMWP